MDNNSVIKPIGKLAQVIVNMSMAEYFYMIVALSVPADRRTEEQHKFLAVVTKLIE